MNQEQLVLPGLPARRENPAPPARTVPRAPKAPLVPREYRVPTVPRVLPGQLALPGT